MFRKLLLVVVASFLWLSADENCVQAAGGWSVYIYNCSHPSYGWQRSGTYGESNVTQAQANAAVARRKRSGVSYEQYAAFRSTSQRINAAAPNCGGSPARPTCIYWVYISNSRAESGWLGGYRTSSEAQSRGASFVRAYGGRWQGPCSDCR